VKMDLLFSERYFDANEVGRMKRKQTISMLQRKWCRKKEK
jgi:hypothetical protein